MPHCRKHSSSAICPFFLPLKPFLLFPSAFIRFAFLISSCLQRVNFVSWLMLSTLLNKCRQLKMLLGLHCYDINRLCCIVRHLCYYECRSFFYFKICSFKILSQECLLKISRAGVTSVSLSCWYVQYSISRLILLFHICYVINLPWKWNYQ